MVPFTRRQQGPPLRFPFRVKTSKLDAGHRCRMQLPVVYVTAEACLRCQGQQLNKRADPPFWIRILMKILSQNYKNVSDKAFLSFIIRYFVQCLAK